MTVGVYYYSARNTEGALVRGAVEAADESVALGMLRTRALFVTALAKEGSPAAAIPISLHPRVGRDALVAFFRSFATMIGAGMPMNRALQVGAAQTRDTKLAEALRAVHDDIGAGASLGDALARRPKEFSEFAVAMIRAGESGGVLDAVLERLAQLLEDSRTLHKRVAAALVYPSILIGSAAVLVVFLMVSILPMFASLYQQLRVPLPWETAGLLGLASAARAWRTEFAMSMIAVVASATALQMRYGPVLQRALQERILHVPALGDVLRKAALAQVARSLGTLLRSGVDLLRALEIVSTVVQNAAFKRSLAEMRTTLREGGSLCGALAQDALYDAIFVQMVGIGEESGALDAMLLRVATYYEVDVEAALTALTATLEPALMLVLGGLIGLIVFTVFIPLYSLIGRIT